MKQFRKDKIRMYAFLTACFIVLVLLSTVGVFAASSGDMGVLYDISDDDILYYDGSDSHNAPFITETSAYDGYLKACVSNSFLCTYNNVISSLPDETVYTNYAVFLQSNYIFFLALPEGSFFTFNDATNHTYLYAPKGFYTSGNSYRILGLQYNNDGTYHAYFDINPQTYKNNTYSYDGVDYGCIVDLSRGVNNINDTIFMSSVPIYYTSSNSVGLDSVDFDTNYNTSMGSDIPDDETDLNNLYLPTSDFKWNCSKYGDVYSDSLEANEHATENMIYSNRWGSGGVQFTCVPTDYQIAHSDDFYITFEFQFWTKGWVQFAYGSVGDNYTIEPSNSTFSSMKLFTNPYTVDIDLSDIIEDGNQHYFVMQNLFDNSTLQQYNLPYLNFTGSSYGSAVRNMREYYSISWDNSTDLGWKGQARAVLHSRNINNEYSGNNTETYNFLTQISKQTDDSMSTNNYPYSPSEEDVVPDSGSGSNSQTMTYDNGQIILTNNDNDTININDGNAETVENLYNDLTTSDGEDSLSERFVDLVNENAWITIMQETFSFIPSSIWVSVEIFVVTCLGILAGSFVLRIILDLL